jgi:phenolic acid decarboxylase
MTGYKMTRGQNDWDEMTGDKTKGDESYGNRIVSATAKLIMVSESGCDRENAYAAAQRGLERLSN